MNYDLQQNSITQQLIDLENDYNYYSNNRFANKFNYTKKLKNIQTFVSGRSKMLVLLSRFKVAL